MKTAFGSRLITINNYFVGCEKFLLCFLLFATLFLGFGQVVLRNIFSMGFVWIDHVLRICVLWIAFTGAALATEYKGHIKIDVMQNIIQREKTKRIIEILALVSTLIICTLLFAASVDYLLMLSSDSRGSVIPRIPDWWFRGIIPYCFLMMIVRCFIQILTLINDKKDIS